ncbi:hypothetical protein PPSIR1_05213 [Plesiocystis pacifica SIR-1]|uniref:Uncharacterized protein n=1 Tax=Plesiocystis pacifica SIR-1 TaxID=391625 RepID=A6FX15_9BACT|nr:hypothetical protein PPSIR1_05213 [Plesiocystis pacifica SIR-1]
MCLVIGSMALACAQRGVNGDEAADEVGVVSEGDCYALPFARWPEVSILLDG